VVTPGLGLHAPLESAPGNEKPLVSAQPILQTKDCSILIQAGLPGLYLSHHTRTLAASCAGAHEEIDSAVWPRGTDDEQGRARSKVIGRKRDAEAFDAEVVRRKRTGDLDLLTGGKETLAEFAEEWWKLYAVPNLAPRTLRS